MSVVHDVILDGGIVFTGSIGETEIEALFEAASERCLTEADQRNTYLTDALDNLDRHRDFEPEPEEVREHLRGDDLGDWRKVVTVTAFISTREYLGEQATKDIDAIKAALDEASGRGYCAVEVHADCPWGWAPHERETDWTSGVFFEWARLDGDVNVTALCVRVSGGDVIWMQLDRR
jgi:hypothetical protein